MLCGVAEAVVLFKAPGPRRGLLKHEILVVSIIWFV